MTIKTFKPYTAGRRQMTVISSEGLAKEKKHTQVKKLTSARKSTGGRNNLGRMTVRHQGSGVKRKYRTIDFKRDKVNVPAKVQAIVYDPNRTCDIALLAYVDGEKRYILAPNGIKVGDVVITADDADVKVGNSKMLKDIPVGTLVHNVELNPGAGGQMARSAGAYVQVMAKEQDWILLRLPSGELRRVKENCRATIGQVGRMEHEQVIIGKAGRRRKMGVRPGVRGVAMNPIDHPHGGGEGKTSGGRHPVTPWGMPTRGYKTRKNKRTDKFIVKRRK
jgi:large subunit ribosomal protein L2